MLKRRKGIKLPKKPLFNVREVSELFRVNPQTVYGWIYKDKLPAVKIGGSIRIPYFVLADITGAPQYSFDELIESILEKKRD
ncbi:MAG TPA: DNA-binding protein [Candidatus Omnitrophica bacterium]|nr:DNA-binding protein [Candidatus Omnitrophota bacterium]